MKEEAETTTIKSIDDGLALPQRQKRTDALLSCTML
jgi:hypothetical protein